MLTESISFFLETHGHSSRGSFLLGGGLSGEYSVGRKFLGIIFLRGRCIFWGIFWGGGGGSAAGYFLGGKRLELFSDNLNLILEFPPMIHNVWRFFSCSFPKIIRILTLIVSDD